MFNLNSVRFCEHAKMKKIYILYSIIAVFLSACGSKKNLVYFSDLLDSTALQRAILPVAAPKIQAGDILSIQVSSLSPESNILFNSGVLPQTQQSTNNATTNVGSVATGSGYQVDSNGDISFPVIGKIRLAGLNKEEAQQKLIEELNHYVKEPIVNIRYLNFKITVLGEVNRPATYTVDKDRVNVLEALGLAGDITLYGLRENVLVIREQSGQRTMIRLNLKESEVFDSPYFYLQQNDIVYVQPSNLKDPKGDRTFRIITTVASVATAITVILWRLF